MEKMSLLNTIEKVHDDLEVTARLCQLLSLLNSDNSEVDMSVVGDTFHAVRLRIEEDRKILDDVITEMYTGKQVAHG